MTQLPPWIWSPVVPFVFGNDISMLEEVAKLRMYIKQLIDKVNEIGQDLTNVHDTLNTHTNAIADIQNKLIIIDNTLADMQKEIDNNSANIDKNTAAINKINVTLNTIQNNITEIENTIQTMQSNISTLQTDVAKLKTDTANNTSAIENINNNIATIQSNITTIQSNISTLNSSLSALANRVTEAENEIISNTNDIGTLQTQMQTANDNITKNTGDIVILKKNVQTNTDNITDLKAFEISTNTNINNINNNIGAIQTQVNTNTSDITNIKATLGNIPENIGTDVTELEKKVKTNTDNISQNAADIAVLESGLESLENDVDKNKADISNMKSDVEQNKTNITNLETEVDTLQNDVNSNMADISALQADKLNKNPVIPLNYVKEVFRVGGSINQSEKYVKVFETSNIPAKYAFLYTAGNINTSNNVVGHIIVEADGTGIRGYYETIHTESANDADIYINLSNNVFEMYLGFKTNYDTFSLTWLSSLYNDNLISFGDGATLLDNIPTTSIKLKNAFENNVPIDIQEQLDDLRNESNNQSQEISQLETDLNNYLKKSGGMMTVQDWKSKNLDTENLLNIYSVGGEGIHRFIDNNEEAIVMDIDSERKAILGAKYYYFKNSTEYIGDKYKMDNGVAFTNIDNGVRLSRNIDTDNFFKIIAQKRGSVAGVNLGSSSYPWDNIYVTHITSSDIDELETNITNLEAEVNNLKSAQTSYEFNEVTLNSTAGAGSMSATLKIKYVILRKGNIETYKIISIILHPNNALLEFSNSGTITYKQASVGTAFDITTIQEELLEELRILSFNKNIDVVYIGINNGIELILRTDVHKSGSSQMVANIYCVYNKNDIYDGFNSYNVSNNIIIPFA